MKSDGQRKHSNVKNIRLCCGFSNKQKFHCSVFFFAQVVSTRNSFTCTTTKMSDNLFKSLPVQDLKIPIVLEKEFTAACCIRGYHIYSWTGWTADIGSILTVKPEVRPGALSKINARLLSVVMVKRLDTFPNFCHKHIFSSRMEEDCW